MAKRTVTLYEDGNTKVFFDLGIVALRWQSRQVYSKLWDVKQNIVNKLKSLGNKLDDVTCEDALFYAAEMKDLSRRLQEYHAKNTHITEYSVNVVGPSSLVLDNERLCEVHYILCASEKETLAAHVRDAFAAYSLLDYPVVLDVKTCRLTTHVFDQAITQKAFCKTVARVLCTNRGLILSLLNAGTDERQLKFFPFDTEDNTRASVKLLASHISMLRVEA